MDETNGNVTHQSSDHSDMKIPINPQRASQLTSNLNSIRERISSTLKTHSLPKPPRLVAVSKLKPASDILALHNDPSSHQHFGENYVQELLEKSRLLPKTIRWHFIGGLQSNKCVQLAREVESLWAVESVDSVKKANLLEKGRKERDEKIGGGEKEEKLRVFVQVNTSGEDSKSGVEPDSEELLDICRTVREQCPSLQLQGIMTIGAIARSRATTAENENEDFVKLREVRERLAKDLGVEKEDLELSMGMSEDFEGAIVQGSNEVRVGSTIFGERPPKKEAKVMEETEEEKN